MTSTPRARTRETNVTAISDLEIFAQVARTRNMSAAGRELGLSPAVVSKRVSLLEDKLGARLFQRTTRHLTLTETGEGYYHRVVDILSLVSDAEDFVNRRNTRPRGQLRITAPTTFSRLHVAPYIADFRQRYPDIELDIQLTDDIVDIIRDNYDLAIRIAELEDSSLVARKLAPETRVICAAKSYLDKHGRPTTIEDLENHDCFSAGAQDVWRIEGPGGRQEQLRFKAPLRTNSSEFLNAALRAGLGIGLRAVWEIGPDLKSGALEVVLPEWRGSSNVAIHAVYPTREFLPAKVNAFFEFLVEMYGSEPYWEKEIDLTQITGHRHDRDRTGPRLVTPARQPAARPDV